MENEDYKKRMPNEELEIYNSMSNLNKLSYLSNAFHAENEAKSRYPQNTQWNGIGDAYRHALFHARNSITIGVDLSTRLGDAHEIGSTNQLEIEMDKWNNDIGRRYVVEKGFFDDPDSYIQKALEAGRLRYLTPLNTNGSTIPGVSKLMPTDK